MLSRFAYNGGVIRMLTTLLLLAQLTGGIVNDDRDVIQAALLTFFHHENWHSADWRPKKQLVLRTQFSSKARPDFKEKFTSTVEEQRASIEAGQLYLKDPKTTGDTRARIIDSIATARKDLVTLAELQERSPVTTPYQAPDLLPLKSMAWDPRIRVTDNSNRYMWSNAKRDPSLEEDTIYAWASRPCFSADGQLAFVQFSIPWSMHHADVILLMERTSEGWAQRLVFSRFYV